MADKRTLRQVYLEKRLTLTQAEYNKRNQLLVANILRTIDFSQHKMVHIFLSIAKQKEVDTPRIIKQVKKDCPDVNFVVSKTSPPRKLHHYLLSEETELITNSWGIPEPREGLKVEAKEIDVVFVPLISFDKAGNRIGYGGGYYDVFLDELRPDSKKIGLSLSPSLDQIQFVEEFDIPLDSCITPFETFIF